VPELNSFERLDYTIDAETVPAAPIEIPAVIPKATRKGINWTALVYHWNTKKGSVRGREIAYLPGSE
jgi:hypothetical protein